MTSLPPKYRVRRRGALLLIVASLSAVSPLGGLGVTRALADDDGGGSGGGGSGGGSSGGGGSGSGGSDDGGSDDGGSSDGGSGGGGSDDGGSEDGGSDGGGSDGGGSGSGSGGGSGSGSSSSSSGAGKASAGQSSQVRDGDLAKRLKNRIAPVAEVEALASKIKPGEVIDIKLFKSRDSYVYRVKVMQRSGSIYDLTFDAVSRKLLSTRER